jgi:hypothetical protein
LGIGHWVLGIKNSASEGQLPPFEAERSPFEGQIFTFPLLQRREAILKCSFVWNRFIVNKNTRPKFD